MERIPDNGRPMDDLLREMEAFKEQDIRWRQGRNFAYVYFAGDQVLSDVQRAYMSFFSENGLNPSAFPSLRKMEAEVLDMTIDLFNGPSTARGSMTSGGTESILMAVKTARAWAESHHPEITQPEIVLPATAHPAFHKACYYFKLKAVVVPVGTDFRVRASDMAAAISDQPILLVGSAPADPQGVIDPIAEIGQIAKKRNILMHVDACVGGFMLPFLERAGYPIPTWDFRVEGVTSISADIHKYGYAAKGASTITYRTGELRKKQFYVYTPWSGGIYASPSMCGTRPGGAIAAAWAVLQLLGKNGYTDLAKNTMETALHLRKGIEDIKGVQVLTNPDMCLFALSSNTLDIYEVGDELTVRGWYLDRQQLPPSLHFTITAAHFGPEERILADLREAVQAAQKRSLRNLGKRLTIGTVKGLQKALPESTFKQLQNLAARFIKVDDSPRSAAMYGMMGSIENKGDLEPLVREFLDQLTQKPE